MCFFVNKNAGRPDATIAYKIMRAEPVQGCPFGQIPLESLHKSSKAGTWTVGIPKKRSSGSITKLRKRRAKNGIYVYPTKDAAILDEGSMDCWDDTWVLVEVQVSPQDFLLESNDVLMRTYEKVTPIRIVDHGG